MKRNPWLPCLLIACAIGLAWLESRPAPSISASNPPATRPDSTRPSHLPTITLPRHPVTRPEDAPPGRWKDGYSPDEVVQAASLKPGKLRDRLLLRGIRSWAATEPERARQWAARCRDPRERELLLQALGGDSHDSIVEKLARSVTVFATDDSERANLEELTEQWATENLADARAWVMEQSEGELRDALIHRIALVQARTHPEEAIALVLAQLPPGADQDDAIITVLHQWALKGPAAATWVNNLPSGALRQLSQRELDGLAAYRAGVATQTTPPNP